jgi:hypothetical protein
MNSEENLMYRVGLDEDAPPCRRCRHAAHAFEMCGIDRCACSNYQPMTVEDILEREGQI